MPLVGKPKPPPNPAAQQVAQQSQYTAQVYVNRKKVWETQAATSDQAYQAANQQAKQYEGKGLSPHIVVRKSP